MLQFVPDYNFVPVVEPVYGYDQTLSNFPVFWIPHSTQGNCATRSKAKGVCWVLTHPLHE